MSRHVTVIGWDDVPHLSQSEKDDLMQSYHPHQRAARTRGVPQLGSGAIYPVEPDEIKCEPFSIPDHWPRAYAMDVGWKRTAVLWGARDPESGILYLYSEHYQGEAEPPIHATAIRARGAWIRGAIDPAARGRAQKDGEQLMQNYHDLGLQLVDAVNAVESGIYEVWTRLSTGRLKVFSTLQNFWNEYRLYRRDEKGRIVKRDDHLMDCYDEETEVLTREGWKPWPQATDANLFATVNIDTDEIEYQAPTEMIARSYVGEMVRISGRKMDAMVTPNHRMVVYRRGDDEPSIRLAGDLSIWDRIKLRATWKGEDRSPIVVEAAHGRPAEIDPLVWAEFLGWYVAEGSYSANVQMPGRGYQVCVSQVKQEGIDRLRNLLAQTPWTWGYRHTSFVASNKWLWQQVAPLGRSGDKHVPQWVKDSSPDVIEAFIRGAIAGDGWTQGKTRTYATVSQRLADDMQELFFKIGKTASLRVGKEASAAAVVCGRVHATREQYWVCEWNSPYGLLRDNDNKPNISRERYAGMVYCATVPNGTLVVRRNGKPMIAGNCKRYLVMTWESIAMAKPVRTETPEWRKRLKRHVSAGGGSAQSA